MSLKIPQLKEAFDQIISGEPSILIEAMLTHADMNIRRQSAAYLADGENKQSNDSSLD